MKKVKKQPETPLRRVFNCVEKFLNAHPVIVPVFMVAICFLLLISRKWQDFIHPQFWAEDGVVWFSQAYNAGFIHTIFEPYSGTFSIFTRLVGGITVLFPIHYAPLLFNLAALACQLLPVFLINSKRLRSVTQYRTVGILVSLLYVALPNDREVFMDLANVQWHLGIAAFLILIATPAVSKAAKAFDVGLLLMTGLTGPIGIALLPVAALMYYKKRTQNNLYHLVPLAVATVIQLISIFIIEPGQRSGHQDTASFLKAVKMFTGQVVTGGIFGQDKVDWLYSNKFLLYVAFFAAVALILYVVKVGPRWLAYANMYSVTIILFMLASQKPLEGLDIWESLTQPGIGQRYWYIPIFVWVVTVLWVVLNKTFLPARIICAALLVSMLVYGIPNSWFLPTFEDLGYQYYVREFDAAPKGYKIIIPINPGGQWEFPLVKR